MPPQTAEVSATVVQNPWNLLFGALFSFTSWQDPYSYLLGIAFGLCVVLMVVIIHMQKKCEK